MTYLGDKDFLIEVQKGKVAGHSIVHKFGRNTAVGTGSFEIITFQGGSPIHLTAPTTVRVKAGGDANDTAAGSGARSIEIFGLDSNLDAVSETVATAGASASSSTTASFWDVYRLRMTAGTYRGVNADDVVVENTAGTQDLITMEAGTSVSQYGRYTVASGVTAYFLGALLTLDSNQKAAVRYMTAGDINDTSAPMAPAKQELYWPGITGTPPPFAPKSPIICPALTTMWFEALSGAGSIEVNVDFEILLVDD